MNKRGLTCLAVTTTETSLGRFLGSPTPFFIIFYQPPFDVWGCVAQGMYVSLSASGHTLQACRVGRYIILCR